MAGSRLHRRLVAWLTQFRGRHARWCLAGGIGVGLLAAVAWYLTFWAIKFILWGAFSFLLSTPFLRSAGAVAGCAALMFAQRRANLEQLRELETEHPALKGSLPTAVWITGDALFVLTGPKTLPSAVKVVSMIVLTAPRLTQLAGDLFRRSQTAQLMDLDATADVLAILLKSDRMLPLDELIQNAPQLDWRRALREATLVDGVQVRLGADPLVVIADSARNDITDQLEKMEAQRAE